jgi:hypothetical protein
MVVKCLFSPIRLELKLFFNYFLILLILNKKNIQIEIEITLKHNIIKHLRPVVCEKKN